MLDTEVLPQQRENATALEKLGLLEPAGATTAARTVDFTDLHRCRSGPDADSLVKEAEHPAHLIGVAVNGHWGGLFDDLVCIPYADAMLHRLPAGVDPLDWVTVGDVTGANDELARRHVVNGARTRVLVLAPGVTGARPGCLGSRLRSRVCPVRRRRAGGQARPRDARPVAVGG
ncbi:hypothetical protein [Streptomyces sp. NPDC060065]|uniref:hypothetical protein n=1 Tax=Streptomyces sp. NPDC060065 TaxID=3347050 RepID=UPI0036CBCB44